MGDNLKETTCMTRPSITIEQALVTTDTEAGEFAGIRLISNVFMPDGWFGIASGNLITLFSADGKVLTLDGDSLFS